MSKNLLEIAASTDGHLYEEEGEAIAKYASRSVKVLEVGCYHGRSTLYGLSGLPSDGLWISVDPFIEYGKCIGMKEGIVTLHKCCFEDPRFRLIPTTVADGERHIIGFAPFDMVFLDGHHSYRGTSQDAAFMVSLVPVGALMLFHDNHQDGFPGVTAVTSQFVKDGILEKIEQVRGLGVFRVVYRPTWLTHAGFWKKGDTYAD